MPIRAIHLLSKTVSLLILLLILCTSALAQHKHYTELKIGVLSKSGDEIALQRWGATAEYLNKTIQDYHFSIKPISFDHIEQAIQQHEIDFLLTNSGMFVDLTFRYKLNAIATLKRKILGKAYTEFGSVVFTKRDNESVTQLTEIIGKKVAAVNEQSLGGWIAALREFDNNDLSVDDFASLEFLGTHEAVVNAITNNQFDVGIVRTDTLERMAAERKIELNNYRVLRLPYNGDYASPTNEFPLLHTSRLYPEWPFAAMPQVSELLAEQVSSALLIMRETDEAAIQARIMGWTIPKNYREVDYAYSQLKIGFYKNLTDYSIIDVIIRYWKYFLIAFLTFTSMVTTTLYIISLNRKLKDSREKLRLQATHDALTGLPNRVLFFELANKYLKIAGREQHDSMILFLDLDKFKQVNDTYGHDAGDELLKDTANRIANCLRDTDLVARIGGDEFLVMLANVSSMDHFKTIMQRIISTASMPFVSPAGDTLQIGCSIGASHYPRQGEHLTELIKKADLALYQAKNNGRGNFVIYSEEQPA